MASKLPPWLRDLLVLAAVFAVLLGGLYAYTGTWPPAVIVESGSMMHKECSADLAPPACDDHVKYGRSWLSLGETTIDPGDLVLVKDVDGIDDVMTLVEGGTTHYGKPGDVIVYYPGNNRDRTPIIHRAVAYVQVTGSGDAAQYWVRWSDEGDCVGGATKVARGEAGADAPSFPTRDGHSWCVYDQRGILIPEIPLPLATSGSAGARYTPIRSGFFTKGDNPSTNVQTDQESGLSRDERGAASPVAPEWIQGKARGELPWLGLIKLSLAGRPNEPNPPKEWKQIGSAYAPKDLWVMLGISLFVLVGVPLIYDGYKAIQSRRGKGSGAPGTPVEVSGFGTGPASIELSWRPPAEGAPPASYHVYRGQARVGTVTETRFADTGLVAGVSYVYAVAAVDAEGREGPRSPTVSVATQSEPPAAGS